MYPSEALINRLLDNNTKLRIWHIINKNLFRIFLKIVCICAACLHVYVLYLRKLVLCMEQHPVGTLFNVLKAFKYFKVKFPCRCHGQIGGVFVFICVTHWRRRRQRGDCVGVQLLWQQQQQQQQL